MKNFIITTLLSLLPEFWQANDIEADGTANNAINIQAGSDFTIVNSDLNSSSSTASGVDTILIQPDASYSVTRGIRIAASSIHDAANEALYVNAMNVSITGSQFFDVGHVNTNPAVIEVGPNATDVTVNGSFIGQRYGDPDQPGYGVVVDNGASGVALTGNNYHNATVSSVYNLSSNTIGFAGGVANNGAPVTSTTCAANTACSN